MSCGCKNKAMSSDLERQRRLAKNLAVMEQCMVELRIKADGSYTFNRAGAGGVGEIVEYIHYL